MNWKEAFSKRKFIIEFSITVVLLVSILIALAKFLNFAEARNGVTLDDPLLKLFKPVDLTWLTFALIYISLFAALLSFIKKPVLLITAFQSYVVLVIFRITAMFILPLNPPERMISLSDPFVEFFGTGQLLTKDLFFSGHTATIFLFFLLTENKKLKVFFFVSTIIVAVSVLLQHVHYSVDVFTAPFFVYASFQIEKKLRPNFSADHLNQKN